MYANGQGVDQSFTTAKEWFQKAAAQGDEHAIKELKRLNEHLKSTTTTSTDDKKSTSSTTPPQEDEDDCPICMEALPKNNLKFKRMTCCGKGMHQACAKKKFNSRSMTHEQKSTCCLCRTKLPTKIGTKETIERLRFWIARGKAWSMNMLGDRYRTGIGVPHDDKQAVELYTMAADQDYVSAMYNLGIMYYNGDGTDRNVIKGKELLLKAATLGHDNAMLTLKRVDKHEKKATPSFTPTRTHCSYCGVAHAPPEVKLNPCSGCHSVFYCSKEHQKIDWKLKSNGHKQHCKELQTLK